MGKCCIRFKNLEDLALDVIAQTIQRVPAKTFIKHYEAALSKTANANAKGRHVKISDRANRWNTEPIDNQQAATSRGPVEFADVGDGLPILYFHGTGAGYHAVVLMEFGTETNGLLACEKAAAWGAACLGNDCGGIAMAVRGGVCYNCRTRWMSLNSRATPQLLFF